MAHTVEARCLKFVGELHTQTAALSFLELMDQLKEILLLTCIMQHDPRHSHCMQLLTAGISCLVICKLTHHIAN
jgi:hypothetical protein